MITTGAVRFVACSHCGSDDVKRSQRRNVLERASRPFLTPWRCDLCGRRFFSFSWTRQKQALKAAKQAGA